MTGVLFLLLYRPLSRSVMGVDEWVVSDRRHLWLFVLSIFVLPALLLALGFVIGPIHF